MTSNSRFFFEHEFISSIIIIFFVLFAVFYFIKFTKKDFRKLDQEKEIQKNKPLADQKIDINNSIQFLLLDIKHILIVISFLLFILIIA